VKEFVSARVPGAPDFERDAGAARLPDVVAREGDAPLAEEKPIACSRMGPASTFTVKNERSDGLLIMWIDHDCREKFWRDVGPRSSQVVRGQEADAWRLRDRTGALVADIVPAAPDTTTYISVP
jgi:hypothetical protein